MQARVFGEKDLTHSAFAKLRADFVTAEFCAGEISFSESADQDDVFSRGAAREEGRLAVA